MEAAIVATDERQAQYQALVQQLLQTDAATVQPSHGEIEVLVLIDAHQASTMLLYLGWSGNVRHHDVIVHVRIRDGKIWIEHDGTTEGFANVLCTAGVPPEDIVLAFQHPRKRSFTGFGTGTIPHLSAQ